MKNIGVEWAVEPATERSLQRDPPGEDADADLADFVAATYARAYRTAFLILHDRSDAEEAVQEAFLRAWRFRAAVRDGQATKQWLYRVLVNTCYSKLRAAARRPRAAAGGDEPMVSIASDLPSPADLASVADVVADVRVALAGLPESLRVPVVLRYFADLSEKEIAAVIHRRPGTVKSRLHEARRRLGADRRLARFAEEDAQ